MIPENAPTPWRVLEARGGPSILIVDAAGHVVTSCGSNRTWGEQEAVARFVVEAANCRCARPLAGVGQP